MGLAFFFQKGPKKTSQGPFNQQEKKKKLGLAERGKCFCLGRGGFLKRKKKKLGIFFKQIPKKFPQEILKIKGRLKKNVPFYSPNPSEKGFAPEKNMKKFILFTRGPPNKERKAPFGVVFFHYPKPVKNKKKFIPDEKNFQKAPGTLGKLFKSHFLFEPKPNRKNNQGKEKIFFSLTTHRAPPPPFFFVGFVLVSPFKFKLLKKREIRQKNFLRGKKGVFK